MEKRQAALQAIMEREDWQREVEWLCRANGELMIQELSSYFDILRDRVARWGKSRGDTRRLMTSAWYEYREKMILDLLEIPEYYRKGLWDSTWRTVNSVWQSVREEFGLHREELLFMEEPDWLIQKRETYAALIRKVEYHWGLIERPVSIFESPGSVHIDLVYAVERLGTPAEEVFSAAFAPWFGARFGRALFRQGAELIELVHSLREGSRKECREQAEQLLVRLDEMKQKFVDELPCLIEDRLPEFVTEYIAREAAKKE